jgi:hypothetical protein
MTSGTMGVLSNVKKMLRMLGNIGKNVRMLRLGGGGGRVKARTMGVLCSTRKMLKMSSNVKKTSQDIGGGWKHWKKVTWYITKQIVAKDVQGHPPNTLKIS